MSSERPCWEIYNVEMSRLNNGHALWQPAPLSYFDRVQLGDVGYIREGCFNLLFSATSPPHPLKKLDVGRILNPQPQDPGYLTGCRETRVDFKPPTSPSSEYPVSALQSGSNFKFLFTEEQGAALVTKYQTYKENAQAVGKFEKFTKENYASWVEYAHNAGHGDVNPVLVTGIDRTKDFSMMCYSNYDDGLECEFRTSIPGTAPASAWGTWKSSRFIYTNHGPQPCRPPSSTQAMNATSSGGGHAEPVPDDYNQCTFVRYFTMRYRRLWVPKIIKAGAGPHDLGSGDRENAGSLPGIEDNSDSSSDRVSSLLSCDGDDGGLASSVDSGSDVVVHNPTIDKTDDFDVIADYIFQNSNAKSVLLHHRDFALLREPGGSVDLHAQLLEKQPQIIVDENEVGTIWCQESSSVARPHSPTSHNPSPLSITQVEPPLSDPIAPDSTGAGSVDPIAMPPTPDPPHTSHAATPNSALPSPVGPTERKTARFTGTPLSVLPRRRSFPFLSSFPGRLVDIQHSRDVDYQNHRLSPIRKTCLRCQAAKSLKCDGALPCYRCTDLGLGRHCAYETDEPRGTRRGSIAGELLVHPHWDSDIYNSSSEGDGVSDPWGGSPRSGLREFTFGTEPEDSFYHSIPHRRFGIHTHPSNVSSAGLPSPPPRGGADQCYYALHLDSTPATAGLSCRCLSNPSITSDLSNLTRALDAFHAFIDRFAEHNTEGCVVMDRIADLNNVLPPRTAYVRSSFAENSPHHPAPRSIQRPLPLSSPRNQGFGPPVDFFRVPPPMIERPVSRHPPGGVAASRKPVPTPIIPERSQTFSKSTKNLTEDFTKPRVRSVSAHARLTLALRNLSRKQVPGSISGDRNPNKIVSKQTGGDLLTLPEETPEKSKGNLPQPHIKPVEKPASRDQKVTLEFRNSTQMRGGALNISKQPSSASVQIPEHSRRTHDPKKLVAATIAKEEPTSQRVSLSHAIPRPVGQALARRYVPTKSKIPGAADESTPILAQPRRKVPDSSPPTTAPAPGTNPKAIGQLRTGMNRSNKHETAASVTEGAAGEQEVPTPSTQDPQPPTPQGAGLDAAIWPA